MSSRRTQEFPLAPLSRGAQWFFPALCLVLVVVAFLLRHDALLRDNPANPVPPWLIMIFGMALVVIGPFVLLQYRRVRIADGSLIVQAASLFTRKIGIATLDLEASRILDLDEHTDYRPTLRLWGFGLPGFSAGHYLLRNRARAYCLLTRREKTLVLPRRGGGFVLLSPEKPQALLDALRATIATRGMRG